MLPDSQNVNSNLPKCPTVDWGLELGGMANLKLTEALTYRYHFICQFMGTCFTDGDKEIFHYHFSEFLLLWCTDDI